MFRPANARLQWRRLMLRGRLLKVGQRLLSLQGLSLQRLSL
jgi:hypothetical protein